MGVSAGGAQLAMTIEGDPSPSGAMAAHPICNRGVSGFESPLGLHGHFLYDVFTKYDATDIITLRALATHLAGVGEWLKPPDCKSGA